MTTMLTEFTYNRLGIQKPVEPLDTPVSGSEQKVLATADARITCVEGLGAIYRSSPRSTESAVIVTGQMPCNIQVHYREGERLFMSESVAANDDTESHPALPLHGESVPQGRYGLKALGGEAFIVSYRHGPKGVKIDFAELLIADSYALTADVQESLFPQKFTYTGDIVSTHTRTAKTYISHPGYTRLINRLWDVFDSEVLEDGMFHPAEEIIDDALDVIADQHIYHWFKAISLNVDQPSFASSVLRCLARRSNIGTIRWRVQLVRDALKMEDIEIRDAAVQAVESWGGRSLAEVIRAHTESEPWLQQYIRDVIDDLGD